MIVIINYATGNLGSIANMLKKTGAAVRMSSAIDDIEQAEKLVLPGVGAFDEGIKNLRESGLIPVLNYKVLEKKTPILGICLGMQLFTRGSEEGDLAGLGWINGTTIRFNFDKSMENRPRIPHMGWNTVSVIKNGDLFHDLQPDPRFYFVHSYHVLCEDRDVVLSETCYGYDFTSSFNSENITGVQFHPEKSHRYGMKLLENFVKLC
jgi:glutamine amidotransferase